MPVVLRENEIAGSPFFPHFGLATRERHRAQYITTNNTHKKLEKDLVNHLRTHPVIHSFSGTDIWGHIWFESLNTEQGGVGVTQGQAVYQLSSQRLSLFTAGINNPSHFRTQDSYSYSPASYPKPGRNSKETIQKQTPEALQDFRQKLRDSSNGLRAVHRAIVRNLVMRGNDNSFYEYSSRLTLLIDKHSAYFRPKLRPKKRIKTRVQVFQVCGLAIGLIGCHFLYRRLLGDGLVDFLCHVEGVKARDRGGDGDGDGDGDGGENGKSEPGQLPGMTSIPRMSGLAKQEIVFASELVQKFDARHPMNLDELKATKDRETNTELPQTDPATEVDWKAIDLIP
ncbi:hypothetical protein F4680DRAFT_468034 [Xylaria scruposa]|nr:hypothetical protein F4680DRAFT_468034 [Xylaria scruposa]